MPFEVPCLFLRRDLPVFEVVAVGLVGYLLVRLESCAVAGVVQVIVVEWDGVVEMMVVVEWIEMNGMGLGLVKIVIVVVVVAVEMLHPEI